MLLLVIEQSVVVPFQICFDLEDTGSLVILQLIIDFTYAIDIFISFNTGIYHHGVLILNRNKLARIYVNSW